MLAGDGFGGAAEDLEADRARTGKGHGVDAGVGDQGVADVALAGQQRDGASRYAGVLEGFGEIKPPPQNQTILTAQAVQSGPYIPPVTRVLTYSSVDWESLVEEWAFHCLRQKYLRTERFTGANDKGVDIAGFVDSKLLRGVWDNYQCKHIDHPLQPSDVWVELGKILWYSFNGDYAAPRAYYFVGSQGIGPKLTHFLSNIYQKKLQFRQSPTQTTGEKRDAKTIQTPSNIFMIQHPYFR